MNKGKRYTAQMEKVDRDRLYPLNEAVDCLLSFEKANFDETVELAFRLGIDPRQSDQTIRGAIVLPQGTGKNVQVVVIAAGDAADAASEAGADVVGYEDVIERIKGGWLDFDVLVTTPSAMKDIRALGRVLGPRGLMPNPKTGTLTDDVADAVKQAKAGRVEYRNDRGACVHVPIGRRSFSAAALMENADAIIQQILQARPSSIKGTFLRNIAISASMSPSIKIDTRTVVKV